MDENINNELIQKKFELMLEMALKPVRTELYSLKQEMEVIKAENQFLKLELITNLSRVNQAQAALSAASSVASSAPAQVAPQATPVASSMGSSSMGTSTSGTSSFSSQPSSSFSSQPSSSSFNQGSQMNRTGMGMSSGFSQSSPSSYSGGISSSSSMGMNSPRPSYSQTSPSMSTGMGGTTITQSPPRDRELPVEKKQTYYERNKIENSEQLLNKFFYSGGKK